MYTDVLKNMENEMKKAVDYFSNSLSTIRAGRANPRVLDGITFSYYGTDTPIKNAATISVPEARLLVIQPWDKTIIKDIEKAILASDLGITPMSDGTVIRLPFPELTGERREQLTKDVKSLAEDSKVTVRNHRRDAMNEVKKMEKSSEITEDDLKDAENEIQEITDKYTDEIDTLTENKSKELMEI